MAKHITLTDNDLRLIKRIEQYQETEKCKTFTEAVRQLCDMALKFKELTK